MFYIDATYNGGVKISFVVNNNSGDCAGFCVYCNPMLKNQVQTYNPIARKNYVFSSFSEYIHGDVLKSANEDNLRKSICDFIDKLSKYNKEMIRHCCDDIDRGFNKFKKTVALHQDVYDGMQKEISFIMDIIVPSKEEVKEEWEVLDNDSISREDMSAITKLLSCNDKAEYKGEVYRLHNNNGNYSLEHLIVAGNAIKNDNTTVAVKARKFIRMALMKNAEKLSGFINGNFYPIINEADYNGKKYAVIQDDNGIAHNIFADRVEYVNVFTEPPLQ